MRMLTEKLRTYAAFERNSVYYSSPSTDFFFESELNTAKLL